MPMRDAAEDTPVRQAPEGCPRAPPPPLYRTPHGEQAIRSLYCKALAALPYPNEEMIVHTSFGAAHVVACGPADAPPLMVWHGMGAPAPFMLRLFDPLVNGDSQHQFRVYCPDLPYHAGSRSEDAEFDTSSHEHGRWCLEVLQALRLVGPQASGPPPFHVGVSFGAAVLLDLAAVAPESIRAAGLLVPAGLVPGRQWSILFKLILPSLLYRLLPCRWTAWLALAGMCDEPDDDLQMVTLGWRHVCRYQQMPGGDSGFTASQLRAFKAPTIVITAEHDLFWPASDSTAAAQRILPGCRTVTIPGARHLPGRRHIQSVCVWLSNFFAEAGQGSAGAAGSAQQQEQ